MGKADVELNLFSLFCLLCFWYPDPHFHVQGVSQQWEKFCKNSRSRCMAFDLSCDRTWDTLARGTQKNLGPTTKHQEKYFGLIMMLIYFKWFERSRHCFKMFSMKRSVCASDVTQIFSRDGKHMGRADDSLGQAELRHWNSLKNWAGRTAESMKTRKEVVWEMFMVRHGLAGRD